MGVNSIALETTPKKLSSPWIRDRVLLLADLVHPSGNLWLVSFYAEELDMSSIITDWLGGRNPGVKSFLWRLKIMNLKSQAPTPLFVLNVSCLSLS